MVKTNRFPGSIGPGTSKPLSLVTNKRIWTVVIFQYPTDSLHPAIPSSGGRFSRRLQLDPGLVPPTRWSPSPVTTPEVHSRAESLKSPGPSAIYLRPPGSTRNLAVCLNPAWPPSIQSRKCVRMIHAGSRSKSVQRGRSREVDPPVEVQIATWSPGGMLDWWVKERQQWLGRIRGPDGRQRWVKATDLRTAKSECP